MSIETVEAFFKTPAGHPARMFIRPGTSDWNTVAACLENPMDGGRGTGNEYSIPTGLTGWALDVGAHIGSVTVGLLLDNPDLRVVAIEAVPDNYALIKRNLAANGVADRAVVLHGAAWNGRGSIEVEWDYASVDPDDEEVTEVAKVHRYIGSVSPWMAKVERTKVTVPIITLAAALKHTGGEGFVWAKTDCEGCEHRFFRGPGLRKVGTIIGEWHLRDGTPQAFRDQLSATHNVVWADGDGQGGPFEAVRHG